MDVLLDICCKAGGASAGYSRAGFQVVGTDLEPQPSYPYEFLQADLQSLDPVWIRRNFDAVAASPPCKVHTSMKAFSDPRHTDLIPQARTLLRQSGLPSVIENVPGAPLRDPLVLCGSMFSGCWLRRHRLFELSGFTVTQPPCRHAEQNRLSPGFATARYHSGTRVNSVTPVVTVFGRGNAYGDGEISLWRSAAVMDMPWASRDEVAQAVPPRYTQFIGERLIKLLHKVNA